METFAWYSLNANQSFLLSKSQPSPVKVHPCHSSRVPASQVHFNAGFRWICVAGSFGNGSQWSLPLGLHTLLIPPSNWLLTNIIWQTGMVVSFPSWGYKRLCLLSYVHPPSGLLTCSLWWTPMPPTMSFPRERLTHLVRWEPLPANSQWETDPQGSGSPWTGSRQWPRGSGSFPVEFRNGSSPDDTLTTVCDRPWARQGTS